MAVSKESYRFLAAFSRLSAAERSEVVAELNKILNAPESTRVLLEAEFRKYAGMDLGPKDTGRCPTCGR